MFKLLRCERGEFIVIPAAVILLIYMIVGITGYDGKADAGKGIANTTSEEKR